MRSETGIVGVGGNGKVEMRPPANQRTVTL
jgi:hypothetical protein